MSPGEVPALMLHSYEDSFFRTTIGRIYWRSEELTEIPLRRKFVR